MDYLRKNFSHEIKLDGLAKKVNLSQQLYIIIFKQVTTINSDPIPKSFTSS
ncbi:hypothetical protein BSF_25120 [Bacillus subtilis]|nr:hypothetical protein BSF_25120 [Bacillus subtilis]